ncbi:MAG TPA: amidohydrolase family protein [Burkholderiales bacterium]|nr:amidohydrolase family protein [Burkholderiales bacterium]
MYDTHFHIIDMRFPVQENQGFFPPSFPAPDYQARTKGLGITGGNVVSGSFQGFDTGFMHEALRVLGPTFTGVIQIPSTATDEEILKLDAIGVRGVRFNMVRGGSADVADLENVARRVWALARWHVELYADARDLASITGALSALPAVSIAHLGLSDEGLPTLVKLVEKGMMVKATGFGRMTLDPVKGIRALVKANPDGLMFGTDLPSQRARRPFLPSDMDLPRENMDASLVRKVFFDNAVKFYKPRQVPVYKD